MDWILRFNDPKNGAGPQPLALAILLFKACTRPSNSDYVILGVCKKAISNLNTNNVALVFTYCDQDTEFDRDYAHEWFHEGIKIKEIGMPEIAKDRIFLFKGQDGQGGSKTTHEELSSWIKSIIVPEQAATIQAINYEELVADGMASGNQEMIQAFSKVEELRQRNA